MEDFEKFLLKGEAEIIDKPSFDLPVDDILKAVGEDAHVAGNDDIIYMQQWLCHSEPYINSNGLQFTADDLKNSVSSGQFKPEAGVMVDINHDFNMRGYVIHGETVERDLPDVGKVTGIRVTSVFLAWRFPEIAQKIKEDHENGRLRFSMACFAGVRCPVCGAESSKKDGACDHIKSGESHFIATTPKFVASSIITDPHEPADANAKAIEIAAAGENEPVTKPGDDSMDNPEMDALLQKVKDLEQALEEANAKVRDFETADTAKKITDLEADVSGKETEIAQLKTDLADSEAALTTANAELETLKSKVADLESANEDMGKKLAEHEVEVKNASRERRIRDLMGDAEGIDDVISSYKVSIDGEGVVVGKTDDQFQSFVEALELSKAQNGADVPPSEMVNSEFNSETIPSTPPAGPDGSTKKIDDLFDKM